MYVIIICMAMCEQYTQDKYESMVRERTITFQEFPIRVFNSSSGQFFYASDIATLLGIVRTRNSVKNFDETERVTDTVRKYHGIVTYKKYGNHFRRDDKVILLTSMGVARFIIGCNSPIAKQFKTFFNELVVSSIRGEVRPIGDGGSVSNQINIIAAENLALNMPPQYEYIYVVAELPFRRRVKIGKTINMAQRLSSLQTGNGNTLYVYATVMKPVEINHERVLHDRFANRCLSGEWFKFTWSELELLSIA